MDWWKEESAWEARNMPIGGFMLSMRMIVILFVSIVTGIILTVPFSSVIIKGTILGAFMLLGIGLAFKKVNMVPFEFELLFILTYRGPRAEKAKEPQKAQVLQEVKEQEMFLDSTAPLTFSGKVKVNKQEKVVLYIDGRERGSATVSPANPEYRIYYLPESGDIGTHTITLVLGKEKVQEMKVTVKPRGGVSLIDAKK